MKGTIGRSRNAQDAMPAAPGYVLVVDDDEDMRELLRLHLQNAGYRVITAEDAVAAGHRIVEQAPDLIITDCKMPYMGGLEFIAALRSDGTIPDIPVIFITAMENLSELVGKTFGFPLMAKPMLADELLAKVRDALRPVLR
jgi:DNA-binding response OmpR family regulator